MYFNNLLAGLQPAQLQKALADGAGQLQKRIATVADPATIFNLDKLMQEQAISSSNEPSSHNASELNLPHAGKSDAPTVTPVVDESAELALLADLESAGIKADVDSVAAALRPSSNSSLHSETSRPSETAVIIGANGYKTPSRRSSFSAPHPAPAISNNDSTLRESHNTTANSFPSNGPDRPPERAQRERESVQLHVPIGITPAIPPLDHQGAYAPPPVLPQLPSLPALGADVGNFFSKAAGTVAGTVTGVATSAASAISSTIPTNVSVPSLPLSSTIQTMSTGTIAAGAGSLKRISAVFASPARAIGSGFNALSASVGGGRADSSTQSQEGTPSKGILKFSHSGSNAGNPALLSAAANRGAASDANSTIGSRLYHRTLGQVAPYVDCILVPAILALKCFGPIAAMLCNCVGLKPCVVGFRRATARLSDKQLASLLLLVFTLWLAWQWGLLHFFGSLFDASRSTTATDILSVPDSSDGGGGRKPAG